MEINDIQGTANNSVNISDRISTPYHRFPLARGETKMGYFAHIIFVFRVRLAALTAAVVAASELAGRTRLWRQIERDLIDRHAILAEHPLQSGRHRVLHMTITGMRFTPGM